MSDFLQISVEAPLTEGRSTGDDGFTHRLERLLQLAGVNQSQFAKRMRISSGFVSDVLRGAKQPGKLFFVAIQQEFNVSLDWLISGKGTPSGDTPIRMSLMHTIRLHVALARSAFQDRNPQAKALLRLVQDERLTRLEDHEALTELLRSIPDDPRDFGLVLELYNSHVFTSDPTEQRRNLLRGAVAHFERHFPETATSAFGLQPSGAGVNQTNSGAYQKIAGRDFNEH